MPIRLKDTLTLGDLEKVEKVFGDIFVANSNTLKVNIKSRDLIDMLEAIAVDENGNKIDAKCVSETESMELIKDFFIKNTIINKYARQINQANEKLFATLQEVSALSENEADIFLLGSQMIAISKD